MKKLATLALTVVAATVAIAGPASAAPTQETAKRTGDATFALTNPSCPTLARVMGTKSVKLNTVPINKKSKAEGQLLNRASVQVASDPGTSCVRVKINKRDFSPRTHKYVVRTEVSSHTRQSSAGYAIKTANQRNSAWVKDRVGKGQCLTMRVTLTVTDRRTGKVVTKTQSAPIKNGKC